MKNRSFRHRRLQGLAAVASVLLFGTIGIPAVQASPHRGHASAQAAHVLVAGQASTGPALAEGGLEETKDPLAQDAAWLSESMGLPQGEIYARLQLQSVAGDLESKLEEAAPTSFAGLWLDQGSQFRVVVAATGSADSLEPYIEDSGLANVTDITSARYTIADLRSWAPTFLGAAIEQVGSMEESYDLRIDIPANEILVTASSQDVAVKLEALSTGDIGVDPEAFRFVVGDVGQPDADIYAGPRLSTSTGGFCTAGFSSRTTTGGQRGITTSAHCPNPLNYLGNALTFQTADQSGNQDVQWHSLPASLTAQPKALDNVGLRTITGTLGRSGQPVGALVCGYGTVSHYRCGRVTFKDYAPAWVNSPAATFMVLHENGVDLSQSGDSGGPWYSGGIAYGIHSGQTDGTDAVYMAINYISSLSIAVLTG